jgi:ATP-binding cassette subfamily B protein
MSASGQHHDSDEPGAARIDFALWRRLAGYTRPYRRELIWLAICAVGTAITDASFPLLTRAVIDAVDSGVAVTDLATYALGFLGLTVSLALCVWGFIRAGGRLRTNVSHDIRRDGFANLQRLSFAFYDHRPVGWLMARMTSDCERLSNILAWGFLDYVWGTTLMVGISIAMFALQPMLALVVLAVVPLLMLVSVFFQKHILESSRKVRGANSALTAAYNESVTGVRTTKSLARGGPNLDEFRNKSTRMYTSSVTNALQSALFLPLVLTLGSLATGVALSRGGADVTGGLITIGTLVAFLSYTAHFFDPVQEMAHWFAEMQMAQASAERILGLIDATPDVADSDEVRAAVAAHAASMERTDSETGPGTEPALAEDGLPERIGRVEFHGVGFHYVAGQPVLRNFDLRVEAGQTIALVGSTGGGKSTIVNLLARFYEPTAGAIHVDGIDLRQRSLHWLQSNLGIVLQTPHLFSGTVADNIRYGRLDATDDEVRDVAQLAGANRFIAELPDGFATEVGEGGARLSTGQKQLLSIARAVLADPQVLVMDEATSSVDTETEQHIQHALEHVLEGRTCFVIAHRLSTVRAADNILVIETGQITEQGSHDDLMQSRGRYHELYTRQSLRESDFQAARSAGLSEARVP